MSQWHYPIKLEIEAQTSQPFDSLQAIAAVIQQAAEAVETLAFASSDPFPTSDLPINLNFSSDHAVLNLKVGAA